MARYCFYPVSTRSNLFLWTAVAEAAAVCVIESIIFARIQSQILQPRNAELLTIPVYFAIYLFSQVFLVIITWDALRLRNTIQATGLCVYQISMLVYGALQIDQVQNVLTDHPSTAPYLTEYASSGALAQNIHALLIAVPCVIAVGFVIFLLLTIALHREFGYWLYKEKIGADFAVRQMYTYLEVLVCLLKFDFFFFLGFTLQFILLTLAAQDVEFALTIAVLPLTLCVLVAGAYAATHENAYIFFVFLLAQLSGLAYFIFKTFRLWQPSQAYKYVNTRRTLTVFSAISIVLLIATFVVSLKVMLNFHRGLKEKSTRHGLRDFSNDKKAPDRRESIADEELDFVKRTPVTRTPSETLSRHSAKGQDESIDHLIPDYDEGDYDHHHSSAAAYSHVAGPDLYPLETHERRARGINNLAAKQANANTNYGRIEGTIL